MSHLIMTILVGIVAVSLIAISDSFASQPQNIPQIDVYLIKDHSPEIKNQFLVRHNFDVGFTANLSDNQVIKLQRMGIEISKVAVYQITKPPDSCDDWPACKKSSSTSSRNDFPQNQIPWGIAKIYNDDPGLVVTSGGAGITVAVLDTGVKKNHPDLINNIQECVDFTAWSPKSATKIRDGRCSDELGHGTHVIGTIAANGGSDEMGVFGVSPETDILAYKVCDKYGRCFGDDVSVAIDYAAAHGAQIVSMSFGGMIEDELVSSAIDRNPEVLYVAAAGNKNRITDKIAFPAALPGVIAVGAIDINEDVASFSAIGENDGDYMIEEREIEFGAPGVSVESTCTGSFDGASIDEDGSTNGYCIISGTSMATPHVSGLAAKLWQGNADDTRTFLQERAKLHDLGIPSDDPLTGFGLPTVG